MQCWLPHHTMKRLSLPQKQPNQTRHPKAEMPERLCFGLVQELQTRLKQLRAESLLCLMLLSIDLMILLMTALCSMRASVV